MNDMFDDILWTVGCTDCGFSDCKCDSVSKTDVAIERLDAAIEAIRTAYYDSYAASESIDMKHRDNLFAALSSSRSSAIDSLPYASSISSWLDDSLSDYQYIYTSTSSIHNKEKTVEYGTLFEYGQVEAQEELEAAAPEAVIWGQYRETEYDQVMKKFRNRLAARGLRYWTIEDWLSWANEKYAEYLIEHPGHEPSWYAHRLIWNMNDLNKHQQTKKYERTRKEVELVYMREDQFPVEENTIEHLMTHDQYTEELKNTQLKTWNDCIDWANESEPDAPMPKKLKQRVARLPKADVPCVSVERVTTYNQGRTRQDGWDLRVESGEEYPVHLSKKETKKTRIESLKAQQALPIRKGTI